ncbi:30S ribosomal protein S6e [Candidatus Bathyarchaeota archaeon]|jgi:small subunit ribosomal protein S6e|nr:30S ribosomal protein S6e [Candidatus Bathyarchaeota archaeon]
MAKFKVIVSDPEGTSKVVELEENRAAPLIGRKIGEIMDGSVVNIPGQKIQVTGGSDKDGFPMRPSVHGGVRRRVLLSGGVGFNSQKEGMRKRKTVRGNIITDEIVQINLKIVGRAKEQEESNKVKQKKRKQPKKEAEEAPKEASPQGNAP